MTKKTLRGKIVSDKMTDTVAVEVETKKKHKVYKKLIKTYKKFKARNEIDAKLGDEVLIEESKPFARTVTWKVVKSYSEESK